MKTEKAEQLILEAMRKEPTTRHYGLALIETTGVKPGSLYPALRSLEDQRLIEGVWELDPERPGRIRRRYYKVVPSG